MVVWGGGVAWVVIHGRDTGARYSPARDEWTPTALAHVPEARHAHAAVWTGHEMIVWGGHVPVNTPTATGGHYTPATDRWRPTPLAGAPPAGEATTAWIGERMLLWHSADLWFYRPAEARALLQDGFERTD